MDLQIALILGQDGITNGAIYALLALALVLVFAVTRVIFIPQGEFVAYGALTMATLQTGAAPATIWLLVVLGVMVALLDGIRAARSKRNDRLINILLWNLAYPLLLLAILFLLPLAKLPLLIQMLLTLGIIVPMGPMLYRLVYQPLADASVLILLILSVALHLSLVGLGLLFFGAEGQRTPAFSEASFDLGALTVSGQTLVVVFTSLACITALYFFFERTLYGKALRATAINRVGARLMGIRPALAGKITFFVATLIGAFSGVLIAPITTIYYDTGFLIGLKGFVAAIIGGLASYPLAALGALLVGLLEAFSSFWASEYKEVIVFTLIIPVLLWRSLKSTQVEDEE
ncbi:amino acid/amide ABC transporter membrane protein 1, HAAT family [Thiothrix eikelboomii]|uniref:Amino acid/amide ABC transporter membrane protein 1, HAAT family n=1 Tax=Thiothrix eikelboomii TaxID=92487 RepID=A0A1T4VZ51_9GAMM|nr:branched-chain amino acid ABC transporter permease [Thiothrix eikelboomii]SKA70263.1 amino acid/amide ABC transporter membrane protein 1, HAAT family [Thiothrix eikelboomii]